MAEQKEKVAVDIDEIGAYAGDIEAAAAINDIIYERYELKSDAETIEAKIKGLDNTLKEFCGKHKIDDIRTPIGTLAYMNGVSVSLDKNILADQLSKAGLMPEKIDKIIAAATKTTPTCYVQFRKVKA